MVFLKDPIFKHSRYSQPGSTKYWRSVLNTLSDPVNNKFTPLRDDAHPLPYGELFRILSPCRYDVHVPYTCQEAVLLKGRE